jgi:hypothetical protein
MEIAHDGEGAVEDLPEELDPAALLTAVNSLLETHSAPAVWLYLHLFQLQKPEGWEALGSLLESDERLASVGMDAHSS